MRHTVVSGDSAADAPRYPSPRIAWLVVALLLLVYASSFVDRQVMGLLVMPIRTDLRISDFQFSLLTGLAFALFYAVLGLPIARLVDRGDRGIILSVGVATWSIFTLLCGRATSFATLFLARMVVGVGEATLAPCTYSLLADYFPAQRRGVAMGIFGSGVYLGMGGALVLGGAVLRALRHLDGVVISPFGRFSPWQLAFCLVGAPGLILAALLLLVWEPRRHGWGSDRARERAGRNGLLSIWREGFAAIAGHHLATGFLAMALYGVGAWAPEYLRRTFAMDVSAAGFAVGVSLMVSGTCGVLVGGLLSDVLLRRGIAAARLVVLAGASVFSCPCLTAFSVASSSTLALVWLTFSAFFLAMLTSCGPLGVQELYPPQIRGQGAAVFQFLVTLMGLGGGPAIIAATSDFVLHPAHQLGPAMRVTMPVLALAAAVSALAGMSSYGRVAGRATSHAPEPTVAAGVAFPTLPRERSPP
jgi:MFS family permease